MSQNGYRVKRGPSLDFREKRIANRTAEESLGSKAAPLLSMGRHRPSHGFHAAPTQGEKRKNERKKERKNRRTSSSQITRSRKSILAFFRCSSQTAKHLWEGARAEKTVWHLCITNPTTSFAFRAAAGEAREVRRSGKKGTRTTEKPKKGSTYFKTEACLKRQNRSLLKTTAMSKANT